MSDISFGAPIPIKELPPSSARGGRKSNEPGLRAWLAALKPNGTFELGSPDADKAHPVSRVTQVRKLAETSPVAGHSVKIETRPIESGKRYRIFATLVADAPAPK